jgi:hypothetical protein
MGGVVLMLIVKQKAQNGRQIPGINFSRQWKLVSFRIRGAEAAITGDATSRMQHGAVTSPRSATNGLPEQIFLPKDKA